MNTIKLTTTQLLAIAFLLCGSITIQIHATPTLRANGKIAFVSERDGDSAIYVTSQGFKGFQWGLATDIPVPADYDADGKTDAGVYRDGVWFLLPSKGGITAPQFGLTGDRPTPAAYLP